MDVWKNQPFTHFNLKYSRSCNSAVFSSVVFSRSMGLAVEIKLQTEMPNHS